MIPDRDKVKDWPELAETLQMDGTGIGPNGNNDKLKVYSILVPENTRFYPGFKVFYKQDYKPLTPRKSCGSDRSRSSSATSSQPAGRVRGG